MTTNERLTLLISTVALVVSGFAFWDGHKAAQRDDERARPQLLPTTKPRATLTKDTEPNGSVFVVVRNIGELAASLTKVAVKPLTGMMRDEGADHDCYGDIVKATPVVTPEDEEPEKVLPKRTRLVVALFTLPKSCSLNRKDVPLEVTFTYKDSLNNTYVQPEYLDANVVDGIQIQ